VKRQFRIFVLTALLLPQPVLGVELSEVKDINLVYVLNNFELLKEQFNLRECAYSIRVFRVRDKGECDGTPQSCPQQALYVAVSQFDEYPDQKLYKLPKAYGWEFVEWKVLPKADGKNIFAIFEVKKKVISRSYPKEWWSEERYEVQVNPWKSSFKETPR